MVLICKQCNHEFELTESEIEFYRRKNLHHPKRCSYCRALNNSGRNTSMPTITNFTPQPRYNSESFSNADLYSTPSRTVRRKKGRRTSNITLLMLILLLIALCGYYKKKVNPESSIPFISKSQQIDETTSANHEITYYLNTYRMKFHKANCSSVYEMNSDNRQAFYGTRDEAIAQGYSPCGNCQP